MYAMTITHHDDIVFLDIGFTAGDVLTKASAYVNEFAEATTTCNTVERFLEDHPYFSFLFKRVSQYG